MIKQIATLPETADLCPSVLALTDDGSILECYRHPGYGWSEWQALPQAPGPDTRLRASEQRRGEMHALLCEALVKLQTHHKPPVNLIKRIKATLS
jgi:hypothetical protein